MKIKPGDFVSLEGVSEVLYKVKKIHGNYILILFPETGEYLYERKEYVEKLYEVKEKN